MDDQAVKLSLQDAAAELDRRFPGRCFSLFVWPAEKGQQASYVSTAPRSLALRAMQDLAAQGLPGIPDGHQD